MKKILVVDDSKTIRTMCEWICQGLEDKLLTADSASAARNIINQESPDVVIVDYTLPDTDSYAFVSSIKDRAKVIMLGGTYAPFDADKALSSGAVLTLIKPFKSTDFFKSIEDAMTATTPAAVEEPKFEPATATASTMAPISAPIPPAPSFSAAPIPTPSPLSVRPLASAASPLSPRPFAAPSDPAHQPKGTIHSINPIGGFTSFNSSSAASAPKGIAPIGQHVGPAPIKRFTFPNGETDQNPTVAAASQVGTPSSPTNPFNPVTDATPSTDIPVLNIPANIESAINDSEEADNKSVKTEVVKASEEAAQPECLSNPAEYSQPEELHAPEKAADNERQFECSSQSPHISHNATPATEVQSYQVQNPEPQTAPQIDPDLLRAEVIAAVKTLLPAIVNSYLKKLIQVEVKPQLQKWVDTRVEALIRKMNDQQ